MRAFCKNDLGMVCDALGVAEESVSDYYRLSDTAWRDYPYELKTLAQLQSGEVTRRALAQILRLFEPERPGSVRGRHFYRICLQDHNLLGLLRREGRQELKLPLLTYVLTHELVHVVRFYRFQHLFQADKAEIMAEEEKVYGITGQVLQKVKLPRLDEVVNLYREHGSDFSARAA